MNHCSKCGNPVALTVPDGDNRQRYVCSSCDTVHYQNPLIVVGCVPQQQGRILLCRRSIEPRHGYWTLPAGFMELGESLQQGAARETWEEACAEVEIGRLFASVDVIHAGQVHFFFHATLVGGHSPGAESLETELFDPDDIPWSDLAFKSVEFALRKFIEDAGRDRGIHHESIDRSRRR